MKLKTLILATLCEAAMLLSSQAYGKQIGSVIEWGSLVMPLVQPRTRFTAITAGEAHSLALKSDGTVIAWGSDSDSNGNYSGQSTVPSDLNSVISIDAGGYHSVALKSDATVVTWGLNNYGHSTVPIGLSDVIAIAAGYVHSLALQSDGTVVAWGDNSSGQIAVPNGLGGVMAIAVGYGQSLAIVPATLPALQTRVSGNDITLSWPASSQNFNLQTTTNLADLNSWTNVAETAAIVNARYVITNQVSGASRFYRLKHSVVSNCRYS